MITTDDCIKAVELILEGIEVDKLGYLRKIESAVRPMCQLTAGLHLNIEKLTEEEHQWLHFFGNPRKTEAITKGIKWIKRIDKNFLKICIIMRGQSF